MTQASLVPQVPPEAARAPVEVAQANVRNRLCPVCGNSLRPRQQVCSGRCRAELSRRRQAQARQARDQQIRAFLLAALDLMGKGDSRELGGKTLVGAGDDRGDVVWAGYDPILSQPGDAPDLPDHPTPKRESR